MIIYIPFLVSLVGLIIYLATDNARINTPARDMFWTGLLVTLAQLAELAISLHR